MLRGGDLRYRSVVARISLTTTLLAGLSMAGLAALAGQVATDDRLSDTVLELRRFANAIEPLARDALASAVFSRSLENEARALSFVVYGPNAEPVVPADPARTLNPRIRAVLGSQTPHHEVLRDSNRAVIVYRAPVLGDRGELQGAIEIYRQVELSLPGRNAWIIFAALWLVAIAAATWLYARRVVGRPLQGLREAVDRVIAGDLGTALPMGQPGEIGDLAYRMNEMTARLRHMQSELHRREGELRHSEKLATVGQIAAGLAHEIGTPLGVIAGRARTVVRKGETNDPAVVAKNAQIIADQADRIRTIIQQLLDFSRHGNAIREPTHLNDVIEKALAFIAERLERAHVRLTKQFDLDLPVVRANANEIQQVCLNLALNAVDAMPRGGELLVRTARTSARKAGLELAQPLECALLEISDTGIGITPEHRDHIFEPFFSTKTGTGGSGLGLAVSLGIVRDHEGWIEVASRASAGTTFRVFLPLPSEGAS